MRAAFATVLVASAGLTVASIAIMSSTGDRASRTLQAAATTHTPGAMLLAETDRLARTAFQGALQVGMNDTDEVRGAAYAALEAFAGQRSTLETRASQLSVPAADVEKLVTLSNNFHEAATKLVRVPTDRTTYLAACETFANLSNQLRTTQTAYDTAARDTLATAGAHAQLWTGVSVSVGLLAAAGMVAGVAGFMHAWRKDKLAHRIEVDALSFASQESSNASQARTAALAQLADQFAPSLDGIAIYATQLGQPEASPAERSAVAAGLAAQSRGMANTLLALRDFINADAGSLSLQRIAVPLAPSVREVVDALKPHLPEGTGLRIDVDTSVPQRVLFDRDRLRQAVQSFVALGADEARAGLTQAQAWTMAPAPETTAATGEQQAAPIAQAPGEQASANAWIGSHLSITFDASAGQLVFTLRTPSSDFTLETLQSRLAPLNDVSRMKEPSWRRWLDLAIVDRIATQSGGQALMCSTIDGTCFITTRLQVGVSENTPNLADSITIEFGVPMPLELRQPTSKVSNPDIAQAASDVTTPTTAPAAPAATAVTDADHDHPAANIPITDANVAPTVDCSDAADLRDPSNTRKAA
ncbi:MAG TPA: hypothetical protein VK157_11040 [Phycisphaerales bacterium]|nr:hypothetical protein [Phycisphaerales bacterium]